MGRRGKIFCNGIYAGVLEEEATSGKGIVYCFSYDSAYLANSALPPVSLTLPKKDKTFISHIFFPFFYGLLAEGRIKELQCHNLNIDESDHFGRLLKTAGEDCIGAITVKEELP